jgi:uncharacterized protein involved in exopolysaccharide biosynthesis
LPPRPTTGASTKTAIPEQPAWTREENARPIEDAGDQPVSFLSLINVLLRHRWLVAACTVIGLLLAAQSKLFSRPSYTSTATFIPVATKAPSSLTGMAAQLGIGISTSEAIESPQFYIELLQSREILAPVIQSQFQIPTPNGVISQNLMQWYGLADRPSGLAKTETARELAKRIGVGASLKSGIVSLSVSDASPAVAQQIVARMLAEVSRFNQARRHEKAAAEREFTASQLAETDAALRVAESRLRNFLELNRVRNSPALALEQERLQRDVTMRQELYTATAQAYQQVKIEEARDARSISIIESPEVPPISNPRGLLKAIVLGSLVGFMIGSLLALLREYFLKSQLVRPREGEEFRALRTALWRDLRSPLKAFRRRNLPA